MTRTLTLKPITSALTTLKKSIAELKRVEKKLSQEGCLNAYAHFKYLKKGVQTKQLFVNYPVDANRKRQKKYIGTDQNKQKEVFDQIERHHYREKVRSEIQDLEHEIERIKNEQNAVLTQLDDINRNAVIVAEHSGKVVKDVQKGHAGLGAQASRRSQVTVRSRRSAAAGARV